MKKLLLVANAPFAAAWLLPRVQVLPSIQNSACLRRHQRLSAEQPGNERRKKPSIAELLYELDRRGIRYSPSATRRELEILLERWELKQKSPRAVENVPDSNETTGRRRRNPDSVGRDDGSLQAILKELDEGNVRYPPTASRSELELILRNYRRQRRQERAPSLGEPPGIWQRVIRKGQRAIQHHSTTAAKTAVRTVDRAARKARQASRKVADFVAIDEDTGVRDVEYRYLYRIQPPPSASTIDVTAVPIEEDETRNVGVGRDRNERFTRAQDKRTQSTGESNEARRRPPPRNGPPPRPAKARPAKARPISSPPSLPSTPAAENPVNSGTPPPPKKRRIYSPYGEDTPYENPDVFDRLGEFFADTADRILWGAYDDPDGKYGDTRDKDLHNQTASKAPGSKTASSKRRRPQHWKDRLEQRLDNMMGLNQENIYDRWSQHEKAEAENESGSFDAFSVAQGRQPKRRKKYDKPFWEQEGNLVALLLGRTKQGDDLLFQNLVSYKNDSMLYVFRTLIKSVLVLGSYMCRWASVRGAIPQPVVVLGVITAGICSRRRFRAIVIALILMRTLGELVHGSIYGNEGWEEVDESDEQEEDKAPGR